MNNNKIILGLALTCIQFCAFALVVSKPYDPKPMVEGNRRVDELIEWNKNHPGVMPPLTEQEKYEFFIKEGVPVPGSGAIVSEPSKYNKLTLAQSYSINQFNLDQKTKGFHEENSKKASFLLKMPQIAESEYNQRKNAAFNSEDTHLYETKSNLAMLYKYNGVPANLTTKVIGYAPESIFINNAWAGAVEFFTPDFDAICAYHEVNINITKSTAFVPKDIARYDINNKITTVNVVGSKESGFVTNVEWWDKDFRRVLECSTKDYQEQLKESVITLAKKIDKS